MTTAYPEPAFDAGAPPRAAERLAVVCLAAAIVAGPVALGGTLIWARLGLEAAVAVAVSRWAASGRRPLRLVLAPLALAVIGGLQIVPLPPWLLGLISPLAAAAWNDAAPADWGTVSLDPGLSATGVRRLLLGVGAIAAVATGGTGTYEFVTVGMVRHEMPAWSIGDGFGSYVISNHFAGALSLTVPIAIGLWLIGSRGRMPAAARYGVALGYAAVVLVCCLAFFGPWAGVREIVPEAARRPLQRLRSDGRVVATRVAGQMFMEAPLLGTGFDTFGELQPRYFGNVFHLHYAHNDYLHLLAETGIVGGAIAAGVAGLLVARGRRFYREATPPSRCLDAGPWAALAGLALHSAFDWNLHVPANALLAEAAAGLALSSVSLRGRSAVSQASPSLRRMAAGLLTIACLGSLALLARDAVSTAARRGLATAIVAARTMPEVVVTDVQTQLTNAIEAAAGASRWDPGDARRTCALCRGVPELLPRKGPPR